MSELSRAIMKLHIAGEGLTLATSALAAVLGSTATPKTRPKPDASTAQPVVADTRRMVKDASERLGQINARFASL